MQCPVCDVELKISERQGIEIDYCPKCRGVWLDRGELDKLIERSAGADAQYNAPSQPYPAQERGYYPDHDDDYEYKRKNDDRYYDDDYPQGRTPPYPKKRRSFLDDVFDIFD